MKCGDKEFCPVQKVSHLTRGAWIEMVEIQDENQIPDGRTSHEVRGLKYAIVRVDAGNYESHLTRGAWIEIEKDRLSRNKRKVAPHTRCVD